VTDFIEEIKADLQREKMTDLWNKYSYILAAIVALILAITAGTIWWNRAHSAKQQEAGNGFYKAMGLEASGNKDAITSFNDIKQKNIKGFSALAGLKEAELLIKQGQHDKALAVYNEIASSKNNDRALRELASLLAVSLRIDTDKADNTDDATLQTLAAEGGPWRYSALELQSLRALNAGNLQAAKEYLTTLTKDDNTPSGIKSRAEHLLVAVNAQTASKTLTSQMEKK
jgi:hypothetical protein